MLIHKFNNSSTQTLIPLHNPFLFNSKPIYAAPFCFPMHNKNSLSKKINGKTKHAIKAVLSSTEKSTTVLSSTKKSTAVTAVVTVLQTGGTCDYFSDFIFSALQLELVAAHLDPKTGKEKATIKSDAYRKEKRESETLYESSFVIPGDFGEIGAILIENKHRQEMNVESIVLQGFSTGSLHFTCDSWIQPNSDIRLFFSDKSYLPSQTPSGLKRLREKELISVRGDGKGERKNSDRIYDYDVYNDLGDPDTNDNLARPVLGGAQHPYPRRCRTGRPKTKKDPLTESRSQAQSKGMNLGSSNIYVPRDEAFSEAKQISFSIKSITSGLQGLLPLEEKVSPSDGFSNFTTIDTLFQEYDLPVISKQKIAGQIIPRFVEAVTDIFDSILRFQTPKFIGRDKFAWMRDAEFARQTLAGINPMSIKLVTEWPLKSNLDRDLYGDPESAITEELVEQEIKGFSTLEEALKQKKLFVLDYHDLLLPYVDPVREIEHTTLYGSRTLFFLMPTGTLRPIAIELTRPKSKKKGQDQWKGVFKPSWHPTAIWLWRLAKTHVLAHDSGVHQLVSHWLKTHCCVEPYVIATNRQLSVMHPIYKLLHPHLRYTMEINSFARQKLINAGGIIEECFSPRKYCMELSSVAYDQLWQFDLQALPADLINRGMAVEDPSAPHGLKLTIEDYPYASDGLLLWDAIKQWVTDYVTFFYPKSHLVESDEELQSWWTEIRTVGHGDKKDEPGWPNLKTPDDLIGILTTIIWVASGHHAAVNFGQYDFGGYFPNRPTIARTQMPTEDPKDTEEKQFIERPEKFLLDCFPSEVQAVKAITTFDVLSDHSPDEEYIGNKIPTYWEDNKVINSAFERFNSRLKEIEGEIDARNANMELMNRAGAGVVPYELLKPFSDEGVTGKGVPNSISI